VLQEFEALTAPAGSLTMRSGEAPR
jgi:hypothetical protein